MPPDSQTLPLSELEGEAPRLELLVVHAGRVTTVPLAEGQSVVVGRGNSATVVVPDRGLSRQHVRVQIEAGAAVLTDLGSSNGTFVHGARIDAQTPQRLPFDVPVSAGVTRLVVHGASAAAELGPYSAAVETARRMSASLLNVLLVGERGMGKRRLAHALHRRSPRAGAALAELDVRTTPFDPRLARPGQTLLVVGLDSLGPLDQDRLAGRLTSTRDVRLVGAWTGANCDELQPSLRRVLGEVEIVLPSMAQLGVEFDAIAQSIVAETAHRMKMAHTPQFSEASLTKLRAHRFEDGLRELRAVAERAVAHNAAISIEPEALGLPQEADPWTPQERRERERIMAALDECAGNQSRAAKVLGISRGTLVSRLNKYGLKRPRK